VMFNISQTLGLVYEKYSNHILLVVFSPSSSIT
jgi:hypothetical protein